MTLVWVVTKVDRPVCVRILIDRLLRQMFGRAMARTVDGFVIFVNHRRVSSTMKANVLVLAIRIVAVRVSVMVP